MDRYFWTIRGLARMLRLVITDKYLERRRLQLQELTDIDADLRTKLMRRLRIEELTAHMNMLTGNIFEEYKAY
jgi:hypothetical protein